MSIFYPAQATLTPAGWQAGHGVLVAHGRIAAILPEAPLGVARVALPPGALLAPGYIDVQVNGGGGILFNDDPSPRGARHIAAAHRRLGTTGILPTLITSAPETMRAAAAAIPDALGAGVLGIHFEGPFISPQKPGVHRPDFIRGATADDLATLTALAQQLAGPVVLTLAPECVKTPDQVLLAEAGLILCAGHCAPAFETIGAAIRGVTHVLNAMPPITARDPGVAGAAFGERLYVGVIADLAHVHPALLALLVRAKPADRIMLVSDAMSVAGTDLAGFQLQEKWISRTAGRLQTADGVLAGADLTLVRAVQNMVAHAGMTQEHAIAAASTVPADFLRIGHQRGRLQPGFVADITILDDELGLLGTIVNGVCDLA